MQCVKKLTTPSQIVINIKAFDTESLGYPDTELRFFVLHGLREGFKTGLAYLPTISHECPNLLSSRKIPTITTDLLRTELKKGFVIGPFDYPPFSTVRINPLGVAESKYSGKKRLIVDLSSPHDSEDISNLNDLINKEDFSLSYVKVDDAIRLIKTLSTGEPLYLCKTDMEDAFKQVPLHPTMIPYHGVKWNKQYYFYTRLVFGSRSSPKLYDQLATVVAWILENKYNVTPLLHLLDDFLCVCPPGSDPQHLMDTMLSVFGKLGIPLSAKKTVGPVNTLEYLGVELCTKSMMARLPENKLVRMRQIVTSFLGRASCTKRELLSLLGHLQFACRVITVGRAFTARLLKASTTVKKLNYFVKLNQECRKDLHMWGTLLCQWNGVSLFLDLATTDDYDLELYTDASGVGFGGYYQGAWFYVAQIIYGSCCSPD
jgi:hypothetical protein